MHCFTDWHFHNIMPSEYYIYMPSLSQYYMPFQFFCLIWVEGFFLFFFFFLVLGPHRWHMEVPRLRVQLEPQLPAYIIATAMPDPSHVCDPHYSSWQRRILNPLSEARDRSATSCFLVRFISAAPRRELPKQSYNQKITMVSWCFKHFCWVPWWPC